MFSCMGYKIFQFSVLWFFQHNANGELIITSINIITTYMQTTKSITLILTYSPVILLLNTQKQTSQKLDHMMFILYKLMYKLNLTCACERIYNVVSYNSQLHRIYVHRLAKHNITCPLPQWQVNRS